MTEDTKGGIKVIPLLREINNPALGYALIWAHIYVENYHSIYVENYLGIRHGNSL